MKSLHSRLPLLLALLMLAMPAASRAATPCAIEAAPSATLLVPYFEVDLGRSNGANTIFTVNNASPFAVLAHVTFWTDLSVPTFDFNVYLTGFDAEAIDLRALFTLGQLPQTASAGQDPADQISPQGVFSQDIDFASCNGQLPLPTLPSIFVNHIRAAHTGQPSLILGGFCSGRNLGDRVARGYITIDAVDNCTLRFPTDTGYFGAGGDATDQNVLWGDVRYVDLHRKKAFETNLVHVQAFPDLAAGSYTFYGRYVGWSAEDHREPLPTSFAARYENFQGIEDPTTTDLIVWRDSKVATQPFTCGSQPGWYPLGQESIVAFDNKETADAPPTSPLSPSPAGFLTPFPAESQLTAVDGPGLPVPYDLGWLYLNLNTQVAAAGANPPSDPLASQAWVIRRTDLGGRFRVGGDAIQLDSACQANHTNPGSL